MTIQSTKEKIMDIAIVMFSDRGYDSVSMRDIAAGVGIRASSIYYHFSSKLDILKSMYAFYARERSLIFPNIENVLGALETKPIDDVLAMMSYFWPPQLSDRMDRIVLVASQRILLDKESEIFLRDNFFDALIGIWIPLLTRGIELGKFKSVDINSYAKLLSFFAFCAAELNRTAIKLSFEQWNGALSMLFSLLKPI